MARALRLLIVEDSEDDAEFVCIELRRAGHDLTWKRVDTEPEFIAALDESWDVIISDFQMPAFNGLRAFALYADRQIDTPFIFVSGALGEERAVEAMRVGARDYLLKGDLRRLSVVVEREISEAENRKAQRDSQESARQLEEQLRQAQKMEAIGQLAGGIAHDFNNLLTVILSFGSFALDELDPNGTAHADLREVLSAAHKAETLTSQLLAFSRRKPVTPRVLNLNDVVRDMERMLRRVVGEHIEVSTTLAPELANVWIDAGSFEQVIMNLSINARDAMLGGGKLAISTANLRLDDDGAHAFGGTVPAGRYVVVAVTDDGSGMDETTQSHIFEPFFTTKAVGHGTGLGLSTCYGIVKQAAGHIWVESEPGKGSTFQVLLPSVDAEVDATRPSQVLMDLAGTETILLVEDDDQVRKLALRALTSRGYRVIEAIHGRHALSALEASQRPIHLLLADVVMPEMSGKELAEHVTASNPSVKILYMSGHTPDAVVHRSVPERGAHLLRKPFTPELLLREVRAALDD